MADYELLTCEHIVVLQSETHSAYMFLLFDNCTRPLFFLLISITHASLQVKDLAPSSIERKRLLTTILIKEKKTYITPKRFS